MNSIVVIPARGGSKGLKDKNILDLYGKPLICYTIDEARKVFSDDRIIFSTDSPKIKQLAEQRGLKVHFIRPEALSTDYSTSEDVIRHALNWYNKQHNEIPDNVVLLQPTSPFRKAKHIKEALRLFSKKIDMLVSVKKTHSNPYFTLFEEDSDEYLFKSKKSSFTRRQDCPEVWEYNGAIYVINTSSITSFS